MTFTVLKINVKKYNISHRYKIVDSKKIYCWNDFTYSYSHDFIVFRITNTLVQNKQGGVSDFFFNF